MTKLPTQLKWSRFVCALKGLGYRELSSGSGSARTFYSETKDHVVTFHQPHGNDTLRQGTLASYIRKLEIDRSLFLEKLSDC